MEAKYSSDRLYVHGIESRKMLECLDSTCKKKMLEIFKVLADFPQCNGKYPIIQLSSPKTFAIIEKKSQSIKVEMSGPRKPSNLSFLYTE
jgi:hypothetical protein